MRVTKSLDVHRVRTAMDAKFYGAGIPSQFWSPTPGSYRYRVFKLAEDMPMTPSELQIDYATRLVTDGTMFMRPEIVYVCARENETLSQSLTYDILKSALNNSVRIQIDNAASEFEYDPDMPVVALVNVSDTGTVDRRQRIRDWLHAYEASFRIVCAAAEPQKLAEYLDIRPTMAFLVNANSVVRT